MRKDALNVTDVVHVDFLTKPGSITDEEMTEMQESAFRQVLGMSCIIIAEKHVVSQKSLFVWGVNEA